jgi:hypothetical protein
MQWLRMKHAYPNLQIERWFSATTVLARPSARLARAYLTYETNCERVKVVARSRSGRWVARWEDLKKLHNFRIKTLCPHDPLYAKEKGIATDRWSQEVVDNLNHLTTNDSV